ncbi:MAG: hypothetical protein LCH37_07060 [Bacteroidetes bacterium]|nr:hypothetical protein [Bacteroidota bacterium]
MKEIVAKIKAELALESYSNEKIVELLQELREFFKAHLNEPGLVRMIRLAYEDIEANGDYSFIFLEEEDSKGNLEYLVDLLADYNNKYNREELREIRDLMEGIEREEEDEEEEDEDEA